MFGVDKVNQIRVQGGGFSNKAHFKKWYKKSYLAILDGMLMTSLITWNLSVAENRGRRTLFCHEFFTLIAESVMTYVNTREQTMDGGLQTGPSSVNDRITAPLGVHKIVPVKYGARCAVCRLEYGIKNLLVRLGWQRMLSNALCAASLLTLTYCNTQLYT